MYLPNFHNVLATQNWTPTIITHLVTLSVSNFSQKLLSCLVLPTAIVDDCLAVDLENSEIQKSDKELFIGFAAMQCIQKNNMEGTSGVSIFRKEVRSFYVGCLTYINKKFPLNDAIIKHAVLIDPLLYCHKTSMSTWLFVEGLMVTSRWRTTIKTLFHCFVFPCIDFVSCTFTPYRYPFICSSRLIYLM